MEKKLYIKPHRLLILNYLYPYLTLLIYPALRGILSYRETGVVTKLIVGEVLASLLAVCIAILKYKLLSIVFTEKELVFRKGLFYRTTTTIPAQKIVLVTCENNPFYAIFGAVNLKVYTDAGIKGGADLSIPMQKQKAAVIMNAYDANSAEMQYKSNFLKVLIMATATSSAATGLLISAPIISHAGSIVGQTLNRLLLEKVLEISTHIPDAVPRIAGIVSVVLLIGYLVGVINIILKNAGFLVFKKENTINIRAGILPRRSIVFDLQYLRAVVVNQNFLMRLCGHRSVKMSVGGYGEKRRESSVFLPAVTKEEMQMVLGEFVPGIPQGQRRFVPPAITVLRFLMPPIIIFALILPVRALLVGLFPQFADVIEFLAKVIAAGDLIFALCQLIRYKHMGFSLGKHLYCSGGAGFSFRTITARKDDIEEIIITRFLPDLFVGFCRTTFKIRDKNRDKLTVASLRYKDVRDFFYKSYQLED